MSGEVRTTAAPTAGASLEYGQRRDALLKAVVTAVAQGGMRNLSYRTVAKHAGVAHGLIAHHFGSIDALLEAALLHSIDESIEDLVIDAPSATIEDFARELVAGVQRHPEIFAFQYEVMLEARRTPGLRRHLAMVHERYRAIIRGVLARLDLPTDPGMVHLVYATLEGIVFHQMVQVDPAAGELALERLRMVLQSAFGR